jgi:hypothetical protein
MTGNRYTPEQIAWLKDNRPKLAGKDLAGQFNRRFGVSINLSALLAFCKRKGFAAGRDGRFTTGHDAWNKGLTGLHLSPATEFKPRRLPHNWLPVGSWRLNKDGYRELKTAEPKTWRPVHVLIWEQRHGPVVKGMCIIFRDGDKNNLAIDNLAQVSRSELARLNKNGYGKLHPDIKPVFLTLTRLEVKARELSPNF